MINWRDQGVIISYRRHGESAAIVELLTKEHGRHSGVVRGGGSRKNAPNLQPGHIVTADYSARLEEHLGSFRLEASQSYIALLMHDQRRLNAFNAITALIRFASEERDPHPRLFQKTIKWFESDNPLHAYLLWELTLLDEAGFRLELDRCAVTGSDENLAYISPKTGRAISADAAGEWADRLLAFPSALNNPSAKDEALLEALKITEYFLTNWLAKMIGKNSLPAARQRFIDLLAQNKNQTP